MKCTWKQDTHLGDCYETQCGDAHIFNDGTPKDNNFKYCPYCGGEIVVPRDPQIEPCGPCEGNGYLCTHPERMFLNDDCPTGLDDCQSCEFTKECSKCKGEGFVPPVVKGVK